MRLNPLPGRTVRRTPRAPRRCARLAVEALEDRTTPVVVTPFTPRFSTNDTGDITLIGNTLMTASTVNNAGRTQTDVTNAQNGTGSFINNNNWNLAYVDVDNDPSTTNSSSANLALPAGATVLFAGLYWGSVATTPAQIAARNQSCSTPRPRRGTRPSPGL